MLCYFSVVNDDENVDFIKNRLLDEKINVEHSQKSDFSDSAVLTENVEV